MYFVYKINNLINGKCYIGKTNNISVRWKAHIRSAFSNKKYSNDCVKFYRSLRKYGVSNFSEPEKLGEFEYENDAYQAERNFIKQFNSYKEGLNSCPGGKGPFGSGDESVFAIHKNSILQKRKEKRDSIEKIVERFNSYIKKENDCLIWVGGKSGGYGTFRFKNKNARSHIVSWILNYGNVPNNYFVSHTCSNFLCVNPQHLILITQKQLSDKVNNSKTDYGSNNKNSKLDENIVRSIREESKTVSVATLAKKYNVAKTTITNIIKRIKWKHVI